MAGCSEDQLTIAETAVGLALPSWLRHVFEGCDGHFDEAGQWWVVWPLDRLVSWTMEARADGLLDPSLVAFGDDGTGDPFCVGGGDSDHVLRWSMIDGAASDELSPDAFVATWILAR